MLAKLTQPHENIPAGYRVKVLDITTGRIQVSLDAEIKEYTVNPATLEPIQSMPTIQPEQLEEMWNTYQPVKSTKETIVFATTTKQGVIFTDEGVTISCRCGNITRKILSASIRKFDYERAAINSVIAMCSYCSKP